MEESKLTPFDAETILMIKSVTGHEPEITEKEELFEITMYVDDKDEYVVKAAINAVIGRYGKRIKSVKHITEQTFLRGATFFVEYEKGAENLPKEMRSDLKEPNEKAGHLYCRRLLEVRAVVVTRDNFDILNDFTGGGTMTIPRKPGGVAIYSFPNEHGVLLDVPENWVIVRFPGGAFAKMDYKTFFANFEEKDGNTAVLSFDENRLFEKMNNLFGKDLQCRLSKLTEEYNEFLVASDDILVNGIVPENKTDIIDELADMNAVLFHISALLGYSQKDLLEMAYNKIAGREKNPEYMRKHQHKEPEIPVCGNCNNFLYEDANGYGYCDKHKGMRNCDLHSCSQWQKSHKQ